MIDLIALEENSYSKITEGINHAKILSSRKSLSNLFMIGSRKKEAMVEKWNSI
jgi:ribosomal protein L20